MIEARGVQIDAFDGVAELWWDSIDDLPAAVSTAEGRIAAQALRSDEETFIDLPNSPLFFTNEHLIISTLTDTNSEPHEPPPRIRQHREHGRVCNADLHRWHPRSGTPYGVPRSPETLLGDPIWHLLLTPV